MPFGFESIVTRHNFVLVQFVLGHILLVQIVLGQILLGQIVLGQILVAHYSE